MTLEQAIEWADREATLPHTSPGAQRQLFGPEPRFPF
jgi:hypothetical protein